MEKVLSEEALMASVARTHFLSAATTTVLASSPSWLFPEVPVWKESTWIQKIPLHYSGSIQTSVLLAMLQSIFSAGSSTLINLNLQNPTHILFIWSCTTHIKYLGRYITNYGTAETTATFCLTWRLFKNRRRTKQ